MRLINYSTEQLFAEFLKRFDLDLESDHLRGTPERVVRMYHELLSGYKEPTFKFTTFPAGDKPSLVTVANIEYYSLCAHHLVPFFGKAHISYLPNEKLCGLSKLARVTKHFASKLQVQEEMTEQIADFLIGELEPTGLAVMITGTHLCMSARGVKSPGHLTTTSAMRGKFIDDWGLKEEFFKIVDLSR